MLHVPMEYLGKTLRCKGCKKTFKAQEHGAVLVKKPGRNSAIPEPSRTRKGAEALGPGSVPAVQASRFAGRVPNGATNTKVASTPVLDSLPPKGTEEEAKRETEPESQRSALVKNIVRRQRISVVIWLIVVFIGLGAAVAGLFVFQDQIAALLNQVRQASAPPPSPTRTEERLLDKDEVIDTNRADNTSIRAPEKKGRKNYAKIPGPYPGRALLVGIRNYLYLNPINPGYRPETSFSRDPLGLHTLRRMLITEVSFPREQVLELSDEDDQTPAPPTKATIEATIQDFFASSRPVDRLVFVFVGHASMINNQAYLLPIDAELPSEGGKPDGERDKKAAERMVAFNWLYDQVRASPAKQKLLILDIAQSDPETGIVRNSPGALDEKLADQLKKVPPDVQVWLPCAVKQSSFLFHSSGQDGSIFMDSICRAITLTTGKYWGLIEKDPKLKEGVLPLVLLAKPINKDTAEEAKRHHLEQTPQLIGQGAMVPATLNTEPPPPLVLKISKAGGENVKIDDIVAVLKELDLDNDQLRRMPATSFPPFPAAAFVRYRPDYKDVAELEEQAGGKPLRKVTLKAIRALNKSDKSFKMIFHKEKDESQFKKMVEREQEPSAYILAELTEVLDDMKKAAENREKESSPRWRAHFDYTYARLLAKLAHIQEYNFVLGNKLRKDTPVIKMPGNNAWIIVPQRKMEQKETRSYDQERQKIAAKIIKDYPNTPWEILARREQATVLGLTLQEVKAGDR
jgi:hypothetical protein